MQVAHLLGLLFLVVVEASAQASAPAFCSAPQQSIFAARVSADLCESSTSVSNVKSSEVCAKLCAVDYGGPPYCSFFSYNSKIQQCRISNAADCTELVKSELASQPVKSELASQPMPPSQPGSGGSSARKLLSETPQPHVLAPDAYIAANFAGSKFSGKNNISHGGTMQLLCIAHADLFDACENVTQDALGSQFMSYPNLFVKFCVVIPGESKESFNDGKADILQRACAHVFDLDSSAITLAAKNPASPGSLVVCPTVEIDSQDPAAQETLDAVTKEVETDDFMMNLISVVEVLQVGA
jgi:hypothetical protein